MRPQARCCWSAEHEQASGYVGYIGYVAGGGPFADGRQDCFSTVDLRDVSDHLTSDEFLTQARSFAESGGRADAPTPSNTSAVCPCEANSGCRPLSDLVAGQDLHPLKIADLRGILLVRNVRNRIGK